MTIRETVQQLAETAEILYCRVQCLPKTELEDLREETEACISQACHSSCQLDDLNDTLVNDIYDYIPDGLSVGEYDSLKEVLNKWRTDNGYPAK